MLDRDEVGDCVCVLVDVTVPEPETEGVGVTAAMTIVVEHVSEFPAAS